MEKYRRTRSIREWSRCGDIEEYVWQNGALVALAQLRWEYREYVRTGIHLNPGTGISARSGDVSFTLTRDKEE